MVETTRNLSTNDVLGMSDSQILAACNHEVREDLGHFIREFNKREWSVRISKEFVSFEDYTKKGYAHEERFGHGFVVDGQPVPYFHPNRSFHDEIIWLNNNLYYAEGVSFNDKLINSAVVKFYGPSRTLDIITGFAKDLHYLEKTDKPYIQFARMDDEKYSYALMSNIEKAYLDRQQIWGTTELRTSLQTAARDFARTTPSVIDKMGLKYGDVSIPQNSWSPTRPMRPSDMIHWLKYLSEDSDGRTGFTTYYKTKPSMKDSFEFLTQNRGIGNYYGYHFSSNLARMPGVGHPSLIEREWSKQFQTLGVDHGLLDENADYVVAGPGASATLKELWPQVPINQKTMTRLILAIRDNQHEFFGINNSDAARHLSEASELGQFTTFGCEIACCQYNVFTRLRASSDLAAKRAKAPISKEVGNSNKADLSSFYD